MATLQPERFQQVAQWIEAKKIGFFKGGIATDKTPWLDHWETAFRNSGLDFNDLINDPNGEALATDLFRLKELVGKGALSGPEAYGYLSSKWQGAYQFAATLFKSKQPIIDLPDRRAALPNADPLRRQVEEDVPREIKATPGLSDPFETAQLHVLRIPDGPVQGRDLRQTLSDFADQVGMQLASLKSGQINFRENSLDGAALRPGSVSLAKTDPKTLLGPMRAWPGGDDAIQLKLVRDNLLDRWHETDLLAPFPAGAALQVKGPGRVWRVRRWHFPHRDYRPMPGPIRYRVVAPNMEFGVVAVNRLNDGLLWSDANALYEIVYGAVISGLPNFFDREPTAIMAALSPFDESTSLEGAVIDNSGAFTGTPQLYGSQARADFQTTPPFMLESYRHLSGNRYVPTAVDLRTFRGFRFGLITGDSAYQGYPRLNARNNGFFVIAGDPQSPAATAPQYRGTSPLVPPSVVTADADNYLVGLTWRADPGNPINSGLGANPRVVHGVPFTYADTKALTPSVGFRGTFSVSIEVLMTKLYTGKQLLDFGAGMVGDQYVGAWWKSGVRVVQRGLRKAAVDIIVV